MTRRYLILLYKVVLCAQPKKYFAVSSVYELECGPYLFEFDGQCMFHEITRKEKNFYIYANYVQHSSPFEILKWSRELWLVCSRWERIVTRVPTEGENCAHGGRIIQAKCEFEIELEQRDWNGARVRIWAELTVGELLRQGVNLLTIQWPFQNWNGAKNLGSCAHGVGELFRQGVSADDGIAVGCSDRCCANMPWLVITISLCCAICDTCDTSPVTCVHLWHGSLNMWQF